MSAGRVILLVGTSCAGKSTLARAIQEAAAEAYVALSLDGLFAATPDRWGGSGEGRADGFHYVFEGGLRRIGYGPVGWRLLEGFHRSAAAYARAGVNVVVDDVLLSAACLAGWAAALEGIEATLVHVTAPLPELLRREEARERRRTPGLAAGCLPLHLAIEVDVTVDTSEAEPAVLAERLLAAPLPAGALARVAAMRRSPSPQPSSRP
jgi:chloramphenicol 3-O phosphotransferase